MAKRRGVAFHLTLSDGAIQVRSGEKTLTIRPAASAFDGAAPADFSVDLDAISCWDPPHEAVEIGVGDLQRILLAIEAEFERLGLVVEFD